MKARKTKSSALGRCAAVGRVASRRGGGRAGWRRGRSRRSFGQLSLHDGAKGRQGKLHRRGRRGDGAPAQRRERRTAGRFGTIPRRAGNQDPPPPPPPQARAQAEGRPVEPVGGVKCTVTVTPFSRFADLLEAEEDEAGDGAPAQRRELGRPVGSEPFLAALETRTRRRLHPLKRGPKPKEGRSSPSEE